MCNLWTSNPYQWLKCSSDLGNEKKRKKTIHWSVYKVMVQITAIVSRCLHCSELTCTFSLIQLLFDPCLLKHLVPFLVYLKINRMLGVALATAVRSMFSQCLSFKFQCRAPTIHERRVGPLKKLSVSRKKSKVTLMMHSKTMAPANI